MYIGPGLWTRRRRERLDSNELQWRHRDLSGHIRYL